MQQFSKKVEEGASKFLITKMLGKTKQGREQIFKDWCGWSIKNHDCDPDVFAQPIAVVTVHAAQLTTSPPCHERHCRR